MHQILDASRPAIGWTSYRNATAPQSGSRLCCFLLVMQGGKDPMMQQQPELTKHTHTHKERVHCVAADEDVNDISSNVARLCCLRVTIQRWEEFCCLDGVKKNLKRKAASKSDLRNIYRNKKTPQNEAQRKHLEFKNWLCRKIRLLNIKWRKQKTEKLKQ